MDRIAKDTLSTYNTWIRFCHLHNIYRSHCMKLSFTPLPLANFSGDRGWYALEPTKHVTFLGALCPDVSSDRDNVRRLGASRTGGLQRLNIKGKGPPERLCMRRHQTECERSREECARHERHAFEAPTHLVGYREQINPALPQRAGKSGELMESPASAVQDPRQRCRVAPGLGFGFRLGTSWSCVKHFIKHHCPVLRPAQ